MLIFTNKFVLRSRKRKRTRRLRLRVLIRRRRYKKRKKVRWFPRRTKFKRYHKGRLQAVAYSNSESRLCFGFFGIKILKARRITPKQLEATRVIISRGLRGKNKRLWVRCCPTIPLTTKPQQVRMGKGKGTFDHWVYRIQAGKILFETNSFKAVKTLPFLKRAVKRLGMHARIVRRRLVNRK